MTRRGDARTVAAVGPGVWTAVTLAGGFTGNIWCRQEGDIIRLSGSAVGTIAAGTGGTTVGTIPAAMRPAGLVAGGCATNGAPGGFSVTTGGTLAVYSAAGSPACYVDGVTYRLV